MASLNNTSQATLDNIAQAIQQFVEDMVTIPVDRSIDSALDNAAAAEHELRLLFGAEHRVEDPFLGLINIFNVPSAARRTRARRLTTDLSLSERHIFPLSQTKRRRDFTASTVPNIEAFRNQWDIFTHGALSKMRRQDWNNVVAAGGSVLACLTPLANSSERRINEHFLSRSWGASDIDLFLWGLSPEEAEVKMRDIYKAICASAPRWKVVCVRRAKTVSIHTTWPYRPIQIILRLYQSPAEILSGFDVDAGCLLYNGTDVWASPRALAALIRQMNTIDITRRSPSYEMRLAKYAERGYEIYVPSLDRARLKGELYDRELRSFPNGLARLLVLEAAYSRPYIYTYLRYPNAADTTLPRSIYEEELSSIQIPYGPSWDAKRIRKLLIRKDNYLNERYDPLTGNQAAHRHIFIVGNMNQCIRPVCQECDNPEELEEGEVENEVPEIYIKGPIQFMTKNPGSQLLTGSFRPITFMDWELEAYETRRVVVVDSDSDDSDGISEYADTLSNLPA